MSTTKNRFTTKEFRGKLKPNPIDHIVEFQILVAVLLENKIDSNVEICENFTQYFHQLWNLQILSKSRNSNKGSKVLEYIHYKCGQTVSKPKSEILDEISNIYTKYNNERHEIIEHFKSIKENNEVYLNLEESLYNFLNIKDEKCYKIPIDEIKEKSLELKKKFKPYQVDHIVELQILTYILNNSEVMSDDLALEFIKCFHGIWNFEMKERDENNRKGQMVKEWIKWIETGSNLRYKDEMLVFIKEIYNHYNVNIGIVKGKIESLSDKIDRKDKDQLIKVAADLLELFEHNIPF